MGLEIITLTAALVWGNTFDECIGSCGDGTHRLGEYKPHCCRFLGEYFDECIERRGGLPMGLEITTERYMMSGE